jgi:acetylornithine deacetylase/succinyl-diaminopimelate desuccinylase-like protein
MAIDRDALEAFTAALVRTPSPSGREEDVAALVRAEMERLGYAVEVDALGTVTGILDAGPGRCVLFDARMDTVGVTDPSAWSADPAGELRGTVDMKGPLAALVHGAAAAEAIVEVEGRPSHSSRPELGVNALAAMADVRVAVRALEPPTHPDLGPAIPVPTDDRGRPVRRVHPRAGRGAELSAGARGYATLT